MNFFIQRPIFAMAVALSAINSLTQGVFVLLTLLILAPLFADLPEAVLGAIVIEAVVFGLMDAKAMQRIYRLRDPSGPGEA